MFDRLADAVAGAPPAPQAQTCLQLRLLPAARPLVERLGAAFFRRIPRQPGVYFLRDDRHQLLYVGKAKDLRQRLGSYRYTSRASRKTLRLIHTVRYVEWEICGSETEARLRENALLRHHRPRFNRAGTWPHSAYAVHLQPMATGGRLRFVAPAVPVPGADSAEAVDPTLWLPLEASPVPTEDRGRWFGSFKRATAAGYLALLRLLWRRLHRSAPSTALPRRLLLERPPRTADFALSELWRDRLVQLLEGASDELLVLAAQDLEAPGNSFERQFLETDLELAREFFQRGPQRNLELCRRHHRLNQLILPEEIDDLLIMEGEHLLALDVSWAHEPSSAGEADKNVRAPASRFMGKPAAPAAATPGQLPLDRE